MEALNALGFGLKPVCLHPEKKVKPRKTFTFPSIPNFEFLHSSTSNPQTFQQTLSLFSRGSSIAFLSSLLNPTFSFALTYEEALSQSLTDSPGAELDASGAVESIVSFVNDNPLVIGGGLILLVVPLTLSQLLGGKSKPFGVQSAKTAYTVLGDDDSAQLLDIRSTKEVKEMGSPDISGLRKKPVQIVYNGEDKPGFLKKLALKFKEPENTTLFVLDKFDVNSELVAELATANGFKAAYAIKDGAEGTRGWMNSGLPWMLPKKALSLNFSNFTEVFSGPLPDGDEALSLTLGVAAAAGLGLLAVTEVETILQLLGSAALIQVFSKKLLFAEDRKKTLQGVNEFLDTSIAPKELVSDLKQIGTALLPSPVSSKALPAPTEPSSASAENMVAPAENMVAPAENMAAEKIELTATTSGNNSAPQTESKSESPKVESPPPSGRPRPLSPYASYPDLRPPSSPRPSQP